MTKSKLLHYFLAVGGILAVLAPDLTGLAAALSGLGVGWLNWVAKGLGIAALIGSRWDVIRAKVQPLLGPPSSNTPVVCLLALGSILITDASCKQVKPDQFLDAVVNCAKVNPETSAATAAVITCLTAAVAGNPAACLAGLVTEGHWTIDEVACIVADIAQKENNKVGTANEGPATRIVRDNAVDFLARERIRISNTYPGQ